MLTVFIYKVSLIIYIRDYCIIICIKSQYKKEESIDVIVHQCT